MQISWPWINIWSNDVTIVTFSPFSVKHAGLHFSRHGTQTKTDSFNPQKAEKAQWNGLTWPDGLNFWLTRLKISHRMYFWFLRRYPKFGGAVRRRFFSYSRKTCGGDLSPSSVHTVLKLIVNIAYFFWNLAINDLITSVAGAAPRISNINFL